MTAPKLQASASRVAVVEDDDELRNLVVDDLGARGCAVVGLPSAEALYRHMSIHAVDVVVLDIGLPGESGFGVAAHLRQLSQIGIIILTGRGGPATMKRCLAEGADVFLTKPVDYDVLAAAVSQLHQRLRSGAPVETERSAASPSWSLADGGWTLQRPCGGSLALSEGERSLLLALFQCPGKTVPRTQLIQALTPHPADFDPHRLDMLVHRLRARVSAAFSLSLPLRSVRGSGYVLTP